MKKYINARHGKIMVSDHKQAEPEGELCPFCKNKTMILTEVERDLPYFGKVFLFSMTCTSCKFHKADIECSEKREPGKYQIEIDSEKDMKIRIVKSSQAAVKIPHVATIEPGEAANGYVTNVEGILQRIKHQTETLRDSEEDNTAKKKAKNLIKKLNRVMRGEEKIKLIIEDPTGNSAIISEKAIVEKLKKAKT